jgi:hypothetical protein
MASYIARQPVALRGVSPLSQVRRITLVLYTLGDSAVVWCYGLHVIALSDLLLVTPISAHFFVVIFHPSTANPYIIILPISGTLLASP